MIYLLYEYFDINILQYVTFRAAGAAITALLISFLLGPRIIRTLQNHQIGEIIRKDGPSSHYRKAGTPTMGGIIIILSIILPTILWSRYDVDNPVIIDYLSGKVTISNTSISSPYIMNGYIELPQIMYVLLIIVVVTATSNSVNLTDGLDGLATGLSAISILAMGAIAYATGRYDFSDYLNIIYINGADELLIFSFAALGACLGFLWFNKHPAVVFIGDT